LGVLLAVRLEGVDEGVGGIVRLVELVGLYLRGLLEGLAGVDVYVTASSAAGVLGRVVAPAASAQWLDILCFCILKALAAWTNMSAAFWYFSSRPPKKLKPLPAPWSAFSACHGRSFVSIVFLAMRADRRCGGGGGASQRRRSRRRSHLLQQRTRILGHDDGCCGFPYAFVRSGRAGSKAKRRYTWLRRWVT